MTPQQPWRPGPAGPSTVVHVVREVRVEVTERDVAESGESITAPGATSARCSAVTSRRSTRSAGTGSGAGPRVQSANKPVSRPTTSWPAAIKRGTGTLPRYPSWPVTRTRMQDSSPTWD